MTDWHTETTLEHRRKIKALEAMIESLSARIAVLEAAAIEGETE